MATTGGFTGITSTVTSSGQPDSNSSVPAFSGISQGFSSNPTGFSLTPLTPNVTTTSTLAPTLNFNPNPASSTSIATASSTTGQVTFGSSSLSTFSAPKSTSFNFTSPSSTTTLSVSKSSLLPISNPVTSTSSVITSATTSSSNDQTINYLQLQDLTNKWIADFEDLQKILMNQTAETTNRDVILTSNEDKIEKLVESVKNLKLEQTQVEQQLDFILSQQKDLEECLTSLEDEVSSYFPELPADDMYKLAENIDSRLKKTLETSKEIITKINDKNRSSENVTNPMVAVGHILNHLTNSIQMLENLNNDGQTKLNDLQKLYQQYA